jgi:hypothetical protein
MLVHDLIRDIDAGLPTGAILDSKYEIEDLVIVLAEIDRKVEHLKGLREYRVKSIDEEIAKQENRTQQIRDLILRSMRQLEPNEKTLFFPDVGKVTRKNTAGSYEIEDEAAFAAELEKKGLRDRVYESRETFNKREAKKLAAELSENNQQVPGVRYKEGSETVSITFNVKDGKAIRKVSNPTVNVKSRTNIDELDALEV